MFNGILNFPNRLKKIMEKHTEKPPSFITLETLAYAERLMIIDFPYNLIPEKFLCAISYEIMDHPKQLDKHIAYPIDKKYLEKLAKNEEGEIIDPFNQKEKDVVIHSILDLSQLKNEIEQFVEKQETIFYAKKISVLIKMTEELDLSLKEIEKILKEEGENQDEIYESLKTEKKSLTAMRKLISTLETKYKKHQPMDSAHHTTSLYALLTNQVRFFKTFHPSSLSATHAVHHVIKPAPRMRMNQDDLD